MADSDRSPESPVAACTINAMQAGTVVCLAPLAIPPGNSNHHATDPRVGGTARDTHSPDEASTAPAQTGQQKNSPHMAGRRIEPMTLATTRAAYQPRRQRDRALLRWFPDMRQGMALRVRQSAPLFPLLVTCNGKPGDRDDHHARAGQRRAHAESWAELAQQPDEATHRRNDDPPERDQREGWGALTAPLVWIAGAFLVTRLLLAVLLRAAWQRRDGAGWLIVLAAMLGMVYALHGHTATILAGGAP